MAISKTKNGTFRVRVYIPEEVKPCLGTQKKIIEKRFKTRSDAKKFELELHNKFNNILNGKNNITYEINGSIPFIEFYQNIWWNSYVAGQTTSTTKIPTKATIDNTALVFRKHILPLFGKYTIDFLNQNKQLVLNLLTKKAEEYANFKVIKSYINSIFDWAEELEYIETNRISKTIKKIKAIKKIQLQEAKRNKDLYLSQDELKSWFSAIEIDLNSSKILFKDYVLFYTTFFLGDRKSETYGLQWKHINLEESKIQLVQALDRYKQPKSTKGNKNTTFVIPDELLSLLQKWKKEQKKELSKFGIIQTEEQYVFTYIDTKGNVNSRLHLDYLNNKMKSIRKRHPNLVHATSHKLRHTVATLAKQAGTSIEMIAEALTHTDVATTKNYVNTSNVVPITVGEIAYRNLS